MPFEWLQTPLDAPVSELFARGKRARAIEQIRKQLQGQIAPSVELRIELVDLLIRAGRVKEAVPVLLGLADETARDGFVAKAVAALKRVEKLEPGRADVEERLAKLVHHQKETTPLVAAAAASAPAAVAASPDTGEPDSVLELDLTALRTESAPEPGEKPPALRAAFRRFLEDVGGPASEAPAEAATDPGPDQAPGVASADALVEVEADAEPGPEVEPESNSAPDAMSEADFDQELITIAADVVQRVPAPEPITDERARNVAFAERLLACDLFASVAEDDLLAMVRALKLHVVEPGEVIVAEGEAGEGLYIVAAGAVKVYIRNPSGRNVPIARLGEGQYFGEIASLSGRPRTATVTAAGRTELLELDAAALREMTMRHPALLRRLEDVYVQRVSSPEAAAVRSVPLADAAARARADAALRSHFGEGRWEPRVRLKLAEALLRTGKQDEALALLAALADDLLREGFPEKAVAVLKKIERVRNRDVEVVSLAPLPVFDPDAAAAPETASPRRASDSTFQSWLLDVLRDRVKQTAASQARRLPDLTDTAVTLPPALGGAILAYEPGLRASPLLEGLTEDEQLALLHGLDLVSAQPGDILVSQGERGDSLFILASGAVRIYARVAAARPALVCILGEGAFFGEMATLTDEPRSATVIASAASELLKLDRAALHAIGLRHPRIRGVLEDYCQRRRAG